jgi:Integrase core domain
VLLPDNPKALVVTADNLTPRITPAFLEYTQARGIFIDPARVRHPKDKARVERSVQTVRDDCFGGEVLHTLEEARALAQRWCEQGYGMRRHTRTQRLPREHFLADEKAQLLPVRLDRYDVPSWHEPKVGRDHLAQVARALYSLPTRFIGKHLKARADSLTVRFYDGNSLVKVCARQPPGGRCIDENDFPKDKAPYAMRDVRFLEQQAEACGQPVGQFARGLLNSPLPWTRMRSVYALLGLCRRYGDGRVAEACATAVQADMFDVHRLERMVKRALPPPPTPPNNVIPLARYLRPASQYALPFSTTKRPGEPHD